jgi:hypothetical protein
MVLHDVYAWVYRHYDRWRQSHNPSRAIIQRMRQHADATTLICVVYGRFPPAGEEVRVVVVEHQGGYVQVTRTHKDITKAFTRQLNPAESAELRAYLYNIPVWTMRSRSEHVRSGALYSLSFAQGDQFHSFHLRLAHLSPPYKKDELLIQYLDNLLSVDPFQDNW